MLYLERDGARGWRPFGMATYRVRIGMAGRPHAAAGMGLRCGEEFL